MRIQYLVLFLLLGSITFAFDVSKYTYPEENSSVITQTNFTLDGIPYSIVSIGSTKVFILKSGDILENQSDIVSTLYHYYKVQYYPSDTELQEVKDLFLSFNTSRNDEPGYDFLGYREELYCRVGIIISQVNYSSNELIDAYPCRNETSCDYITMLFGMKILNSKVPYEELYPEYVSFSYASNALIEMVPDCYSKLEGITEDNIYTSLSYVKEKIPTLTEYAQDIEASRFRLDWTCGTCWAICPPMNLSEDTDLVQLDTKLSTLMTKVQPFSEREEIANGIYTQTTERLTYVQNKFYKSKYDVEFLPLSQEASEILEAGNELLGKYVNTSFKTTIEQLQNMTLNLNNSLNTFNFTDFESNLEEYEKLINKAKLQLNSSQNFWEDTVHSKYEAEEYIFILQLKSLDSSKEAKLLELKAQKENLDKNITLSIPSSKELSSVKSSYEAIVVSLKEIFNKQDENFLFKKMRGFARKVNSNLNDILSSIHPLEYNDKKSLVPYLPLIISIVNFVAISSLGVFLFLIALGRMKFQVKSKIFVYIAILLVYSLIVLAGSVFFYFYLDKTTNSADLNEFLLSLSESNQTSILVEVSNLSANKSSTMLACAESLSAVLESHNKEVDIYKMNDGCYKNGNKLLNVTVEDCLSTVEGPVFLFKYSEEEKLPKVSSIFLTQLSLYGDVDYYTECQIASIFEVVSYG